MAKDDPLEAGSSLGKIPIVGETLEATAQSFLGAKLFFSDPEAWIDFIRKDRWAAKSSTLLLAMLMLTYFVTLILGQKTFSYSRNTYEIVNAAFVLIFAIAVGAMLRILGSRVPLLTSVSANVYVLALGLPTFWLYLVASSMLATDAAASSTALTICRWVFSALYAIIWIRSLPLIRDLCRISTNRLVGAIVLAGIFSLALLIFAGNLALEGAQHLDDWFKQLDD